VDLDTASELSGLHRDLILEFARAEWIACRHPHPHPMFDEHAIYRLRQIDHLRRSPGVTMRTVRLIVELQNRVERAEAELRHLRERLG
jgi:hypothetical protein